jgi:hypothetical protein
VAGRIRDLAVSPDGTRIYAASAVGGLWYSGDGGAAWQPVGGFVTAPGRTLPLSTTTLACGAVHVRFRIGPAEDEVWLGTGEPDPLRHPNDEMVQGYYGGIGVLSALGPAAAAPGTDPWTAEAVALRGAAVFSLAEDPAIPRRLVAATTRGLHTHNPAAAPGADPWSLVVVPRWETPANGGVGPGSALVVVTDVVWAGGRLWVAVRQAGTPLTALWRSDGGPAGPWTEVPLPGARTVGGAPQVTRLTLAVAPGNADVLYVLGSSPRMWRIDDATGAAPVVRRVTGLPTGLFNPDGDNDQSEYDMALTVDPADPRRFMIGGSVVTSPVDGSNAAALYRMRVGAAPVVVGGEARWRTDYVGGNAFDDRWVGAEVHADVHRIRWLAVGATTQVVLGCDGGVFRSTAAGEPGTFVSRATGMAVSEAGFVANHPTSDGPVLLGMQDNGVQLRIGEGTWRQGLPSNPDGGGVAFDPGTPGRFIGQFNSSLWTDDDDHDVSPTFRNTGPPFENEDGNSRFYSNAEVRRRTGDGRVQLAVGTNRVWYTEGWGRSFWDAVAGVWRRDWRTLPSFTDPRAGDATAGDALTRDVLPPGRAAPGLGPEAAPAGIRALRWATDHRLYAVMRGAVHRLDRIPGTTNWARTRIGQRPAVPLGPAPAPAAAADPPAEGAYNDLAVHDPGRAAHGSFYLATSHPTEPVWWFDGGAAPGGRWHPAGLGVLAAVQPVPAGAQDGVRAAGYAVAVDPANPAAVFAGTSVGVWRGELTFSPAGAPSWVWRPFNNGLPEAAAQDLAIARYPLAQGGEARLLRAALQARGGWEVDLTGPVAPLVYLRAHPYDTRRSLPTAMADPLRRADRRDRDWPLDWPAVRNGDYRTTPPAAPGPAPHPDGTPVGEFPWHASPDIRVRPTTGTPPPPAPTDPAMPAGTVRLPWTGVPVNRFALWAVQTALHAIDPLVVPDGRRTRWFGRRVAAIRAARGLGNGRVVTAELWNHADVQAGFWADPWAEGGPTEADLVERVVGMATPRPGGAGGTAISNAAVSPCSSALPAGRARVEVCVHHRGLVPAPVAGVAVLLLRRTLPADPATWLGQPTLGALPGLGAAMQAALAGGGAGALPAFPAGWALADLANPVRTPPTAVSAGLAGVVGFAVDLTADAGAFVLLLAVVAHGPGTPVLAGADLRELVRRSPQVAARTVHVV